MAQLELRLLGGFDSSTADGDVLGVLPKKARALLAYLAVPAGKPQPRERLAQLIWGDISADEQARRSLRQALTALRRSLPENTLETGRDALKLSAEGAIVDVGRFERLAVANERDALTAALELYRGDFLEGFSARADGFDEWVDRERRRLRELALAGAERLAELHQRAGDLEAALATAMRIVAMDPLRESGHRLLMRLYERAGRTSEALRQFNELRALLRDELGAEPDAETVTLALRLQTGGERPAQPPVPGVVPDAPSGPALRHVCVVAVAAAEQVSPSGLRAVLPLLESFGGRLVRAGAELLVVAFGLAPASGSELERAVGAALALGRQHGGLQLRAGVASGQVLFDPEQPGAVRGDVLRQASELAERATEGVVVSAAVERALGRRAALAAAEAAPRAQGRRVLRLLGAAETQHDTSFVGRAYELSQLTAALELCARERRGRTFIVRGEAGIGKTRLVSALRGPAFQLGFRVHARPIVDFGAAADHEPVAALVRELLDSTAADALGAIEQLVASGKLPSSDVPLILDAMQALPPAVRDVDPATRDEHLRRRRNAVANLLAAQSGETPRLVWFDDVHWADRTTLAQILALIPVAARAPVLLVLTTRIEGEPDSRDLRAAIRGSAVTTLDLAPLSSEEARELARGSLGDRDGEQGAARVDAAIERAQGNPLFLEQLLQAPQLSEVPPSVQSLVQARLDALEAGDRATLATAAVLGQRFAVPPLAHLLGVERPRLEPLEREALLQPADDGYAFTHVLVREGVYASVIAERRVALHLRAASFYAGRDPLLRAQHLDRGGDPEAAAAYAEAAAAQRRIGNLERADALCTRGLELAHRDSDRFALALQWGEVLCDLGRLEEALAAFSRAEAAARDDASRARACVGAAAALRVLDRTHDALAALASAERLIDPLRDPALLSRVHYLRGNVLFPLGDAAACLRSQTLALETAQSAGSLLAEARALSGIADAHFMAGRVHTARVWFARTERSARAAGDLELELSSSGMLALLDLVVPKLRESKATCLALIERCGAAGVLRPELLLQGNVAWTALFLGEFEAAFEHATRAAELAARIGAQRFEALALAYGAIARTELDPECSVERELDRALQLAQASGIGFAGGAVYAARLTAERRPERLRDLFEEAQRAIEPRAMYLSRLILAHQGAVAALRAGDAALAEGCGNYLRSSYAEEPHELGRLLTDFSLGLAACMRGERSKVSGELAALRERLARAELYPALACFDTVARDR